MNDKRTDTNDKIRQIRREHLIEHCLQIGMPVVGNEDEETLEMYIELAHDDDFDDFGFSDDDYEDRKTNVNSDVKKTSVLGKFVSLFM